MFFTFARIEFCCANTMTCFALRFRMHLFFRDGKWLNLVKSFTAAWRFTNSCTCAPGCPCSGIFFFRVKWVHLSNSMFIRLLAIPVAAFGLCLLYSLISNASLAHCNRISSGSPRLVNCLGSLLALRSKLSISHSVASTQPYLPLPALGHHSRSFIAAIGLYDCTVYMYTMY